MDFKLKISLSFSSSVQFVMSLKDQITSLFHVPVVYHALKPRLQSMVGDNYVITPFSQLSTAAQLAIVWFMAIDDDRWSFEALDDSIADHIGIDDPEFKVELEKLLPFFIKRYGHKKFGFSIVPTEQIKDSVLSDHDVNHSDWDGYSRWYSHSTAIPEHSADNLWPLIIYMNNDETVADGTHRLMSYIQQKQQSVPVVFFT